MAKTNSSTKPKDEVTAIRDELPFFKKGHRNASQWWHVKPSGEYATDLETGKRYARAFIPLLSFNVGPAALGWVISSMLTNNGQQRGIDAIATGFILEIGGSLQSAMIGLTIAAVAIEQPGSDLGPKFVELFKTGNALRGSNRSTLFHNPNASILEVVR
jgi:hypothetical protein